MGFECRFKRNSINIIGFIRFPDDLACVLVAKKNLIFILTAGAPRGRYLRCADDISFPVLRETCIETLSVPSSRFTFGLACARPSSRGRRGRVRLSKSLRLFVSVACLVDA
ncbi:hypothetical protein EVAR_36571_1 [Eumeta japonica]|uniref:Uncharacterized protein n=1 Tax=Eumeta variegata TaxID=151549 RepID=A0A4C1Y2P0_EUMVA|nr:hypothetical protein EVAR_36571_1 [Eumeta japonica]